MKNPFFDEVTSMSLNESPSEKEGKLPLLRGKPECCYPQ